MKDDKRERYRTEIGELIESRREFIERNYIRIRFTHQNHYSWPELDTLRHEISLCLIFGLNQASITLTNHMIESLLKNALIVHDAKSRRTPETGNGPLNVETLIELFRPALRMFGKTDLGDNINRACKAGLIDKNQKEALQECRSSFRNAYSHSDKANTFGEGTVQTQAIRFGGTEIGIGPLEEAKLKEFVIGHGIFQAMQAEKEAIPYFLFIDTIARQIREKLFGPIPPEGGEVSQSF